MRSRIGILIGWMLVTLTAIGVTSAAVGSVRANVTDSASLAFRVQGDEPAPERDIQATFDSVTSSTTVADPDLETFNPTTSSTEAAETEPPVSTTTVKVTTAPSQPATTNPPPPASSTTTTTTPNSKTVVKTYTVVGGTVTVEGSKDRVTLLGAVPKPGFSAKEEERSDPQKVVVKFESSSHTSKIVIEWRNGKLVEHVDEEND